MARGWVARSESERELETLVEADWGPDRQRRLFRRMSIAIVLAIMLMMAIFLTLVALQTTVEDSYAVVYSAPTDLYIGQLVLSDSGWHSFLTATTITLHLTIPEWDVNETRELTYFNRTYDGARLDFLRMLSITGQVLEDTSGKRVEFTVRIEISTPSAEVAKLKFLGSSNSFEGTVTNHPDKPLVELTSSGKGVSLVEDGKVRVRNEPKRDDVEYWSLRFTRTKIS